MSKYTLYIVQCTFSRIESALNELNAICHIDDIIVLMDDAVFALQSPKLAALKTVYVLGHDHQLIDQINNLPSDYTRKVIDYDYLTDLITASEKVHTWR